jgi:hypothetical protein
MQLWEGNKSFSIAFQHGPMMTSLGPEHSHGWRRDSFLRRPRKPHHLAAQAVYSWDPRLGWEAVVLPYVSSHQSLLWTDKDTQTRVEWFAKGHRASKQHNSDSPQVSWLLILCPSFSTRLSLRISNRKNHSHGGWVIENPAHVYIPWPSLTFQAGSRAMASDLRNWHRAWMPDRAGQVRATPGRFPSLGTSS